MVVVVLLLPLLLRCNEVSDVELSLGEALEVLRKFATGKLSTAAMQASSHDGSSSSNSMTNPAALRGSLPH